MGSFDKVRMFTARFGCISGFSVGDAAANPACQVRAQSRQDDTVEH